MITNKYILSEKVKISQTNLKKIFKFLPNEFMNTIVMDLWHYLDPRLMTSKSKVFSTEKTMGDEIVKRMNLNSYSEYLNNEQIKKIDKAIKSLNWDKNWSYDPKIKAFILKY
jgi:hypothetical protein